MQFKLTPLKKDSVITAEWDALSGKRYKQIVSGIDLTYNCILVPELMRLLEARHFRSILDVGCGTGILTRALSEKADNVVGVDPSRKSIEIAKSVNHHTTKLIASSIQEFARERAPYFEVVVANMVLMDTINLKSFLESVGRVTVDGGIFLFSITHPMFWPSYLGYECEEWFDYSKQLVIEAPFRTSLDPNGEEVSTHVHRPLAMYSDHLRKSGFIIDMITEPMPSELLQERYPSRWKYPRYLIARCIKFASRE